MTTFLIILTVWLVLGIVAAPFIGVRLRDRELQSRD